MSEKRSGLGRGLSALIPAVEVEESEFRRVSLDTLIPNPSQPRREFDEDKLKELAASLTEVGMLQPIVVKPGADGKLVIVAGERRFRASRLAGITEVPVIVREVDTDAALLTQALIENVQRQDLQPLEEAAAYQELASTHELTHEDIGKRVGKSRSTITNRLRLLQLPPLVQGYLAQGLLSAGHVRPLIGVEDNAFVAHIAKVAVKDGWSVRQVEEAVKTRKNQAETPQLVAVLQELTPPAILALEETLAEKLGTKVAISHKGNKGRVVIKYNSLDDLEKISRLFYSL
jgi:ParB family chromosome partitioning protein